MATFPSTQGGASLLWSSCWQLSEQRELRSKAGNSGAPFRRPSRDEALNPDEIPARLAHNKVQSPANTTPAAQPRTGNLGWIELAAVACFWKRTLFHARTTHPARSYASSAVRPAIDVPNCRSLGTMSERCSMPDWAISKIPHLGLGRDRLSIDL
ncbi:uncharacterized protein PAN0_001d0151 [Moesziomyces antarcticus]|uniref:Uncharacterized protein n=1 Tax=Pseudozyma antarctica TaxID=84753 RepID=A0A5C3FEE5_PSEA2|nr:uncharacterized protein PAN0_001d0151 [Moesziomyces antarcticus]GAK61956.1 hypothetical protein PAN0_001d0151 [Moesziomyces antarcticus]SPO42476.1 uncharacterized protein PSANT_00159 [Moesziomyces antarcticus]